MAVVLEYVVHLHMSADFLRPHRYWTEEVFCLVLVEHVHIDDASLMIAAGSLSGAVMIVAILLDDICVTHMQVIQTTAGQYSVRMGDSTVYLADAVRGILKCGHVRLLCELVLTGR